MKNKILPILCIFTLITFVFSSFAFATETTDNSSILETIYNDTYERWGYDGMICVIFKNVDETGYTSYSLDGTVVTVSFNADNKAVFTSTGFTRNFVFYYDLEGNYISQDSGTTMGNGSVINTDFTTEHYYFSTVDLYDVNGEIVNPYRPVLDQVTIPALETVEQIPETIITTLKLIIPVGLVVLSTVLVIYLVRLVIYRYL